MPTPETDCIRPWSGRPTKLSGRASSLLGLAVQVLCCVVVTRSCRLALVGRLAAKTGTFETKMYRIQHACIYRVRRKGCLGAISNVRPHAVNCGVDYIADSRCGDVL